MAIGDTRNNRTDTGAALECFRVTNGEIFSCARAHFNLSKRVKGMRIGHRLAGLLCRGSELGSVTDLLAAGDKPQPYNVLNDCGSDHLHGGPYGWCID